MLAARRPAADQRENGRLNPNADQRRRAHLVDLGGFFVENPRVRTIHSSKTTKRRKSARTNHQDTILFRNGVCFMNLNTHATRVQLTIGARRGRAARGRPVDL